jgi:hypothetical protein
MPPSIMLSRWPWTETTPRGEIKDGHPEKKAFARPKQDSNGPRRRGQALDKAFWNQRRRFAARGLENWQFGVGRPQRSFVTASSQKWTILTASKNRASSSGTDEA